jgi:hypothetical protein
MSPGPRGGRTIVRLAAVSGGGRGTGAGRDPTLASSRSAAAVEFNIHRQSVSSRTRWRTTTSSAEPLQRWHQRSATTENCSAEGATSAPPPVGPAQVGRRKYGICDTPIGNTCCGRSLRRVESRWAMADRLYRACTFCSRRTVDTGDQWRAPAVFGKATAATALVGDHVFRGRPRPHSFSDSAAKFSN